VRGTASCASLQGLLSLTLIVLTIRTRVFCVHVRLRPVYQKIGADDICLVSSERIILAYGPSCLAGALAALGLAVPEGSYDKAVVRLQLS
jgi:hypothetical protein